MELVLILRALWQRRLLAGTGLVAAVALGAFLTSHAQTPRTATATTRVVLDTVPSQLVAPAPNGADSLLWRAALLADLLTTQPSQRAIADRAGVRPDTLRVIEPSLQIPPAATALPVKAAAAAATGYEPNAVTVTYDGLVPLIAIKAAARDRATARRLAEAAAETLQGAGLTKGSRRAQAFVVQRAGDLRLRTVTQQKGAVVAVALPIVAWLLWCGALVLVPGLRRAWRTAGGVAERSRAADAA